MRFPRADINSGCDAVRSVAALCLREQLSASPPQYSDASPRARADTEGTIRSLLPLPQSRSVRSDQADGLHVERRELRDSRAGGIEQLEHRRITQPRRRRGVGGLEQRLDLPGRQHAGKIARQFGRAISPRPHRPQRFPRQPSTDRASEWQTDAPQGSEPPPGSRDSSAKIASERSVRRRRESVDALAVAPRGEALEPRGVGRYRIGSKPLDACNVGDERVDGIVQVKGYDLSPPNRVGARFQSRRPRP